MNDVEGACHSFAGGVVTSTHTTLVPPGFRVQHVVTARLLPGRDGEEGQMKYTDDAQGRC